MMPSTVIGYKVIAMYIHSEICPSLESYSYDFLSNVW